MEGLPDAHSWNHERFHCEHCDKTFRFEDIKEKHIKVSHEQAKLYCHYFNNSKCCPNGLECVFLHEESDICKYNDLCERNLCMHKHDNLNQDTAVNSGENADLNEEPDEEIENDDQNDTFINPSQREHVENTDAVNIEKPIFKCDLCDEYQAPTQTQIQNHRIHNHQLHCSVCSKLFPSKTQRRKHLEKQHMDGRKYYIKFA